MAKKILLADDSITIQKVVELTFSDGDYEVTAVNNGAKAIQKLSEMRPDIILSDIIMPEKNGYEVCEFVKSHPEHRNIPVILLTGTFEPFDPDRADKAGCDAVVTKPFESQSLIHKVEELIASSQAAAPAAAPAATHEPEIEPLSAQTPAADPFASSAPAADPFAHASDIFSAPPAAETPTLADMPFEQPSAPAFGGETRAFPRMSFEELEQMSATPAEAPVPAPPPPSAAPEPSPWDEQPSEAAFGGETRAFPRMSFEEMQQMANTPPAAPAPQSSAPEPSPWDAPQEDAGATRAVPSLSFDDMPAVSAEPEPQPMTTPEPSPWNSGPDVSEAAGDAMTPFDAAPAAAPEPPAAASPWDEQPSAFSGETRAFPRMSFEEMQQMASAAAPAASPFESAPSAESPFASNEEPYSAPSYAEPEPEPTPVAAEPEWSRPAAEEPEWAAPAEPEPLAAAAEPVVNPQITDAVAPAAAAVSASSSSDLSDEQVDRIARRVVELMSEQLVRNIAWEVIPEVAEMVVKERIRQLEAEA